MAKTFGVAEHRILNFFKEGTRFNYEGIDYTVQVSGKPTCAKGEPKTDIYIQAINQRNISKEFKISFKKENADFLENKTNAERAEQLLGDDLTCPPKVAPVSKLVINWYTDFERMGKLWQGKTIRWSRSS